MAYRTCENCGTKLQGGRCPNCHEETFIRDQYIEQGMPLPPDDSDFIKKVAEQEKDLDRLKQLRQNFKNRMEELTKEIEETKDKFVDYVKSKQYDPFK